MGIVGGLNVMKPPGMTSHDVVQYVRRLFRERRVGHGGTLDPAAAGVLPVCLGEATKALQFITDRTKGYTAEIIFGSITDTGDYCGKVVGTVEPNLTVTQGAFLEVVGSFVGKIKQIPPMVSAIKIDGQKLCDLARQGVEIDRPARDVEIFSIDVLDCPDILGSGSVARIHVECGKGTYIRTLCQDIGSKLGTMAHMGFLLRTKVGALDISDSVTLEELEGIASSGSPTDTAPFLDMNELLGDIAVIDVPESVLKKVGNGVAITGDDLDSTISPASGQHFRMMHEGRLLAVYEAENNDRGYILRSVRGFN